MTAPIEEWVNDAATPTLKSTFYKREVYGDAPYVDYVKAMSLPTLEREFYIKALIEGINAGGLPFGGESGQVLRKDEDKKSKWAYLSKSDVGLTEVDNTSDVNKPVSGPQNTAILNSTTLDNYSKVFTDKPDTYPHGNSTLLVRISDGWPSYFPGLTYAQVTTSRSRGNQGGTLQWITGYGTATVTSVMFRTSNSAGLWSSVRTLTEKESSKITLGEGALASLPVDYNVGVSGTVVSLGYNSHGNMTAVKKSIAIGPGALSQGLRSRDNVGIGEDALWATESSSADYVQSDRGGTRNVAIGGAAGRYNKTGIGHVLIGRGAGASIVSGNGAVVIGSNANTGAQPIGLSGEIENWGNYFAGDPEARTKLVAVGCEAAWGNSGNSITAVGDRSLFSNTKGAHNTGLGSNTLEMLGSDTWINGGLFKNQILKTGTYVHSGNTLTMNIDAHGASIGDIVRMRLLTGSSATFLSDRAYAVVVTATTNSFTVAHPVSNTASGDSNIDAVISGTQPTHSNWNSSVGASSMKSLVSGSGNSALGFESGRDLINGGYNTFLGYGSGRFLTGGTGNSLIGYLSGNQWVDGSNMTSASGVITLGQYARASGNNQLQLGSSAVTSYSFGAVQDRSDRRDKTDIRDTVLGLDFINKIRPVDFKWAYREDDNRVRERYHHGVIAQEIEGVIKETGIDFGGYQDHKIAGGSDVLSVGYTEFIAPLIKAVQELSEEVRILKEKLSE